MRSRTPCSTWPPGSWTFCVWSARDHVGHRQVEAGELAGVDDDVDLAGAAADDADLADAEDGLELAA